MRIAFAGQDYLTNAGETVLSALLRQGAPVSHSCRKGSCQVCVLRLLRGEVEHEREVDPGLLEEGHILPCVARPRGDIELAPPQATRMSIEAEVVGVRRLAADIVALDIAPFRDIAYRAGQHVVLVREDGMSRPYSLASIAGADFFFSIHVRRIEGGAMSAWLCDQVRRGQRLRLRGPTGAMHYTHAMRERPLLMLATGTGGGALLALAREALAAGHAAPIEFYHGARRGEDLYLHAELRGLARADSRFRYWPWLTGDAGFAEARHGRISDFAFEEGCDLSESEVFLCGLPRMVEEARWRAVQAGVRRECIHADPFDFVQARAPRDAEKLRMIAPDPELWAALDEGPVLTRILDAFYARVFEDARLAPFFHGVSRARAVQKQYEFLADVISGQRAYFGLNPFNAHHWMVISDELFDYRETMFESVLREQGLAEPLIRRWLALHERFRAEIVKAAPRGMVSQGVEQPYRVQSVERLDIDSVCDGCGKAIPAGSPSRYQHRIGALHCAGCAGL
ncbi:MAG TPA: FAD-binding oxidoreductase [Xanthomonadaceae bacterium]|nr:FAD-binding oxidoreductase [Xanthomonadaceae bacterium]